MSWIITSGMIYDNNRDGGIFNVIRNLLFGVKENLDCLLTE